MSQTASLPIVGHAFDADNHYYEALDAFTRHLDPKLGPRVFEWASVGGRSYPALGGRINRGVVNPTFDPVALPGALASYFRGNKDGKPAKEYLTEREPIRPEYRDRDARLRVMDDQGLDKVWMFPTLAVLYEEQLKHDPGAVSLMFHAFNRWLEEDWGFAYHDRIFASPCISLAEVDFAVEELQWALDRGARTVVIRPAAPTTRGGQLPPGHPSFDPFWSLANEAGITVVAHGADSGYTSHGYAKDGFDIALYEDAQRPSITMLSMERAIYDFLASLVFDKLFDRFPNLRVASIENGAEFVPDLFRKLRAAARKVPGYFAEDPVETFRRHVWIAPFWEDDAAELVELISADHILFGSDWPHVEGMPSPLDYAQELEVFDESVRRKILVENATGLNQLQPVKGSQP